MDLLDAAGRWLEDLWVRDHRSKAIQCLNMSISMLQ